MKEQNEIRALYQKSNRVMCCAWVPTSAGPQPARRCANPKTPWQHGSMAAWCTCRNVNTVFTWRLSHCSGLDAVDSMELKAVKSSGAEDTASRRVISILNHPQSRQSQVRRTRFPLASVRTSRAKLPMPCHAFNSFAPVPRCLRLV